MKQILCGFAALMIFGGIVVLATITAIFSETHGPDQDDE